LPLSADWHRSVSTLDRRSYRFWGRAPEGLQYLGANLGTSCRTNEIH
jgi:hypothetical protein